MDSNTPYTSGDYAERHPNWHAEHSEWKAAKIAEMLRKHALKPRSICETGCGAGKILLSLNESLESHPSCTGFEISPQALAIAKKSEVPGVSFKPGSPGPGDGPFDLALAIDVAEHVEDYLGFLRNLGTLAPWKIIHLPLDLSVMSAARPIYLSMAREHVGHLHYFTLETALASVEHAGMKVRDWSLTSVELDLGTSGRKRLQGLRRWMARKNPVLAARWLGGFSVLILAE